MSSGEAIWSKNCNKVRYGRTLGLLLKKWIKVKERKWSPFLGKKIAAKWLCIALSYPVSLIFLKWLYRAESFISKSHEQFRGQIKGYLGFLMKPPKPPTLKEYWQKGHRLEDLQALARIFVFSREGLHCFFVTLSFQQCFVSALMLPLTFQSAVSFRGMDLVIINCTQMRIFEKRLQDAMANLLHSATLGACIRSSSLSVVEGLCAFYFSYGNNLFLYEVKVN